MLDPFHDPGDEPSHLFVCPTCGDMATLDADPASEIMTCDCHDAGRVTRVAFGKVQPRIVITPATDRRFIEMRIGDQSYELDALYAINVGEELLSLKPIADRVASTLTVLPEGGGATCDAAGGAK